MSDEDYNSNETVENPLSEENIASELEQEITKIEEPSTEPDLSSQQNIYPKQIVYPEQNSFGNQGQAPYNQQGYNYYNPYPNNSYGTNYSRPSYSQKMPEFDTQKETKKEKKSGGKVKLTLAVLCAAILFGLVSAGVFYGANLFLNQSNKSKTTQNSSSTEKEKPSTSDGDHKLTTSDDTDKKKPTTSADATETGDNYDVKDIAANCMPSVVAITNLGVSDVTTFWGTYQQESQSAGSGVIVGQTEDELVILTNYHVVASSNQLTVVFSFDEKEEKPDAVIANIKGFDANKDIAVIAIKLTELDDEILSKIKIAVIGDSDKLELGERVVAIGNALGYGQSVTTGIVSALERTVSLQNANGDATNNKYIQTDAAINPGNSGGALLNMKGELVGVNSAKVASSSVEGMGYAIPISDVKALVEELMNRETKTPLPEKEQGYLCISGGTVDNSAIAMHVPAGVLINETYKGYAAAKAGLEAGDIICEIDGIPVNSMDEMKTQLSYVGGGEKVEVTYARYTESSGSYKRFTVTVTLSTYDEFKKLTGK